MPPQRRPTRGSNINLWFRCSAMTLLMLANASAFAQLHRCTGLDGTTTYTDRPCDAGSRKASVSITDYSSDSTEARKIISRDRQARFQRQKVQQDEDEGTEISGASRASEAECDNLRREYDMETRIVTKPDVAKKEGRRLRMEAVCDASLARNGRHIGAIIQQQARGGRRSGDAIPEPAASPQADTSRVINRCALGICYDNLGGSYLQQRLPNGSTQLVGNDGLICKFVSGQRRCN